MDTLLIGASLIALVAIWLCVADIRSELHHLARELDERLVRWRR